MDRLHLENDNTRDAATRAEKRVRRTGAVKYRPIRDEGMAG